MNAIDTNILIYALDQTELVKRNTANALIHQLELAGETLLMWQVLGEYVNWLTSQKHKRNLTHSQVVDYSRVVRGSFPLALPAPRVLDIALDLAGRYSLSHWDSMLLAACIDAGVTTLYTEDIGSPRAIDSLELVNPF